MTDIFSLMASGEKGCRGRSGCEWRMEGDAMSQLVTVLPGGERQQLLETGVWMLRSVQSQQK